MIATHAEGARREAIATADLLHRGFEVYNAACGNSSFDLVAVKFDLLLRVEVKGKALNSHKVPTTSPVSSNEDDLDCRRFDVLAVVDGNTVRYLRSVLHQFNAASKELVGEEIPSKMITAKNLRRRTEFCKSQVGGVE